jgi:endo-1,4-beta-xylanase
MGSTQTSCNEDGSRRGSVFEQWIGDSFIEDAFRATRAADPNALLCYNDYNIEGINAKSNAVYNMVKDFKARGVPIDCVGFQSHLIVGQIPSDFQANLQRFANLGVTVQITEMDIRMPVPASSANLQQQARDYQSVVAACIAVSRCNNITLWGVSDNDSWVPDVFPGYGAPLLFDGNYNPKPAYYTVLQTLGGAVDLPTPTPTPNPTLTPTPPVTPTPTPGGGSEGCHVSYVVNQWPGGFTANLTITNTSSAAINGWSLVFTFPGNQQVTQGWSGVFSQSGSQVTITNASWNSTISANGSANLGFNASWSGSNPSPTAFTLNGTSCNIS